MRLERRDGVSGGLGQRICCALRLGAALARSVAEVPDCLGLGLGDGFRDGDSVGDGVCCTLNFGAALAGTVAEVSDRLCFRVCVNKGVFD